MDGWCRFLLDSELLSFLVIFEEDLSVCFFSIPDTGSLDQIDLDPLVLDVSLVHINLKANQRSVSTTLFVFVCQVHHHSCRGKPFPNL